MDDSRYDENGDFLIWAKKSLEEQEIEVMPAMIWMVIIGHIPFEGLKSIFPVTWVV